MARPLPTDPTAPFRSHPPEGAFRALLRPLTRADAWRRAGREFAVIVAGVLTALGAQAWWDGRQERARERDYLRQLLADTRENERRLDGAIAEDSAAGLAVDRLAHVLHGPAPLPPADTMLALFGGRAFSSSDLQPLSGTFGALLETGELRLIRSDSLRARLVAYAARLEHERGMLRLFQEQAFGDPARLGRSVPFVRRMLFDREDPRRPDRADFERMRRDPDVESALFALQVANRNRLSHLRGLREATRELGRALGAERAVDADR